MTLFRCASLALLAAPLTLALASCGSGDDAGGDITGDAIAAIPAPEGQSWLETTTTTPEDGYVLGNPDAPIKLMEYASLTCPHCADFAEEASGPLTKYIESGVVSYELRNQIHDPLDLTMSMLVRCGSDESFHPLAEQVWANLEQIVTSAQSNSDALNNAIKADADTRYQKIAEAAGLIDFFAARGISRDQAMQCLADSDEAETIVTDSETQSDKLDVTGTPTFFLNGRKLDSNSWAQIEPALQKAGAR
ncbi:protein-disulfide isomerase [Altericroceibacterium spongiae]|uniref:Protein-disulfide isomerase n=1 Tax=Altericroceibacterium spongiae TaxID=2320269 RepID=A0A420EJZ6_9SPHN|nr:thioredoxin domain-containing protein [Altericroceibacterium spongiae]RKF21015.1 protein-disulfide isomerase [Altericroceibacterium spongiae]